ncbi:pre-rRNA-processing protein TSR2 homolog [Coccinella septempunctata]|uniref:pre-rRNA-processing protein TSR2 homolog n=1 Tax=Coccinella septempunctata TaxID=41139 RepID=UPI001D0985FB|nr:pre-rRNA-processing protein TSR2 homolog [Coccinella septempunctata]
MEEILGRIFDRIFNNWTALKLAVEYSQGSSNSLQVANEIKSYMVEYCSQNVLEAEDIQDALDAIMDEEFDTICEDDSTKEISMIIHKFLQLLRENNLTQCEIELNQLPEAHEQWLTMPQIPQPRGQREDSDSSSDNETQDTPMEEDSEWTVVKRRK